METTPQQKESLDLKAIAESEHELNREMTEHERQIWREFCSEHGITDQDLGVDLESGTVDGERVGESMAKITLNLRQKHPSHYLQR